MEVAKTLKPGAQGTARLLREYGERLVCVRYRLERANAKHVTTVELTVDERDAPGGFYRMAESKPKHKQQVHVRIGFHENDPRAKAKAANGRWDPERRGWSLPYHRVQEMGVEAAIMEEEVPRYRNIPGTGG